MKKKKARSRKKNNPEDEEAVNQIKREVELKMQVHSLKHQLRQMKRENAHKKKSTKNETLEAQLQDLTLQHCYGKLPLDGSILDSRNDLLLEAAAALPEWR